MVDLLSWFSHPASPLIIAGPCSVESEQQLLTTASQLAELPDVSMIRGGVWKPRTRPDAFEGRGEEGLRWLHDAKIATGLPVATEVATPLHVEQALKHDIDALWIGARTVVNPFSMQQLADVLKGVTVPVFVKNPVAPDLNLWVGAIERLQKADVKYVAAIHRGFQYYKVSPFRNFPMWELPIQLKRILDVPVITDISHICGCRDLLQQTAQTSVDLAFDGLMVECHCNPDSALTDAQQQITPQQLNQLLSTLIPRIKKAADQHDELADLRAEIDDVDAELLQLLARRMEISSQIGDYKKRNNITIVQMDRWKQILNDHIKTGTEIGLTPELVTTVFDAIHQASIQRQTDVLDEKCL